MQRQSVSLRSKFMMGCALVVACALAAPAAMAHDRYRSHDDHSADVLGALVVGAVIGGVLVGASHHDAYQGGYYYQAPPYAPVGYNSYPAYPDNGGVSIGVVYSNGGGYYRGYHDRYDQRYDRWHGHDRNEYRHGRRGHLP